LGGKIEKIEKIRALEDKKETKNKKKNALIFRAKRAL
jgi:hypothetical protein